MDKQDDFNYLQIQASDLSGILPTEDATKARDQATIVELFDTLGFPPVIVNTPLLSVPNFPVGNEPGIRNTVLANVEASEAQRQSIFARVVSLPIIRILAKRDIILASATRAKPNVNALLRRASESKDTGNREVFYKSIEEETAVASDALKLKLLECNQAAMNEDLGSEAFRRAGEYDLVVIGGGPVGAAYAKSFAAKYPGSKILIIDNGKKLGGNFAKSNAYFLNSTNGGKGNAIPGQDGLNELSRFNAISASEISGTRWAQPKDIVDTEAASIASLPESTMSVLLTSTVTQIRRSRNFTRANPLQLINIDCEYAIDFSTQIVTRSVFDARGVGSDKLPDFNRQSSVDLVEKTLQETDIRKKTMWVYSGYMIDADENERTLAQRIAELGDVTIVGPGDGGNTVVESIIGIGNDEVYSPEADRNLLKSGLILQWAGQMFRTCTAFLSGQGTRGRYTRIAAAFPNVAEGSLDNNVPEQNPSNTKNIRAYPDKIIDIDEGIFDQVTPGKTYKYRLTVENENGERSLRYTNGIIFCTGYQNELGTIYGYGRNIPFNEFADVTGDILGLQGVVLAKRSIRDPNIIIGGASIAAELARANTDLLRKIPALKNVKANIVSLFLQATAVSEAAQIIKAIIDETTPRLTRRDKKIIEDVIVSNITGVTKEPLPAKVVQEPKPIVIGNEREIKDVRVKDATTALQAGIAILLQYIDVSFDTTFDGSQRALTFIIVKDINSTNPDDIDIKVVIPGISEYDRQRIAAQLKQRPYLLGLLKRVIPLGQNDALSINIPYGEDNQVIPEDIKISRADRSALTNAYKLVAQRQAILESRIK